jgi:hypothetical protein
MCPNDLTRTSVWRSPCATNATSEPRERAKGSCEAAEESRPDEEAACVPRTQSLATINLSVLGVIGVGETRLSA